MATDREILKLQQLGAFVTADQVVAPAAGISAAHSRTRDFTKVGTENAATNVAETLMFRVARKAKPAAIHWTSKSSVAGNATDYLLLTVSKGTAGAASVPIASWNTHTSAQSSITGNVPAALVVVSNTDAIIAAGDILLYTIRKVSATGADIGLGTISVDLEEI